MTHIFPDIDLKSAQTEAEWLARLDEIADELGAFTPLGAHHAAFFADGDETLLVSFENISEIRAQAPDHRPRALAIAHRHGWSCLVLLARANRFFRDAEVLDFFDAQVDASFFDSFRRVLFFGTGPQGYAASTFSLAAPGASILAIAPQATLDPDIAPWEDRFRWQRRLDFRSRFGYAPDMLDGARNAFIIYDPGQTLDSMHAALFRRPFVTLMRCPRLGEETAGALDRIGVTDLVIEAAMRGRLTPTRFADLMRHRRKDATYLKTLVRQSAERNHAALTVVAAQHALARSDSRALRKSLESMQGQLEQMQD